MGARLAPPTVTLKEKIRMLLLLGVPLQIVKPGFSTLLDGAYTIEWLRGIVGQLRLQYTEWHWRPE